MTEYYFDQSGVECTVTIPVEAGTTKKDFIVSVTATTIKMGTKKQPFMIEGTLFDNIDKDSAIWQFDTKRHVFSLNFEKKIDAPWPALIRGPHSQSLKLDPHSCYMCAEMYEARILVPPPSVVASSPSSSTANLDLSLSLLLEAANVDHIPALLKLSAIHSFHYQPKYPVMTSFEKRVEFAERAANQGSIDAMILLGIVYAETQEDHAADKSRAIHWYRRAAETGLELRKQQQQQQLPSSSSSSSHSSPSKMFLQTTATTSSSSPSSSTSPSSSSSPLASSVAPKYVLRKEISKDISRAMYALAALLRDDSQFPTDANAQEAVVWLRLAAPDSAPAAYQLGMSYLTGHGCSQDLQAAQQAFALAQSIDPSISVPDLTSHLYAQKLARENRNRMNGGGNGDENSKESEEEARRARRNAGNKQFGIAVGLSVAVVAGVWAFRRFKQQ